jgi:hypothetical protein
MFDREQTEQEARSAKLMERIYHKGHNLGWDGKAVLEGLVDKHGVPSISDEKLKAIGEIFNVILWGELAAWKISASLAFEIKPMEAKMAATSQAHDEARHFYVMKDYLDLIGYKADKVNPATESLLNNVLESKCLAKKLLGMQLMVEPVAITIFKFVRESNIEPVLSELLPFYEKDEARHIALGVKYLPEVLKTLSLPDKIGLLLFQVKLLSLEVEGLRQLEGSFVELGIDPHEVYRYAEMKQIGALQELASELGIKKNIWSPMVKAINLQKDLAFSKKPHLTFIYNLTTLLRRITLGS